MLSLHSPLLPLIVAAVLAAVPQKSCKLLAVALVLWGVQSCWKWWRGLLITIDGVPYRGLPKQRAVKAAEAASPPSARRKARGSSGSDGFLTPRSGSGEESEDETENCGFIEWAYYAPSFPYGKPSSRDVDCKSTTFARLPSGAVQPVWFRCDASVFDVRNLCYKQTKEKVPSDFALYECVGMDIVRDKSRLDCIMDRFPLGDLPQSIPGAKEWSSKWGVPRVLIFNCQVPYTAGRIFGGHPEEDGGLSILNYFVISRQAADMLASGCLNPALRLWKRFVEEGVSTKEGISLKVVARVEDLDKHEVPESFKRFNNKPVLLTKSSVVCGGRLPEVMEIDFDVRSWIYPARSALVSYHHRAREADIQVGYLLEGKVDEELPEQILGCFMVKDMDIMAARWLLPGINAAVTAEGGKIE
eukprot:TRINITY_DN99077_c0_g1_i1.p1 TRINITY_DN99077_c0_g1~~TRINITY_DN99077_c0_g1_i1.p1  ORF type:complete len:426 (-),score=54.91 TRINITY_DN99077_c0_g1_i1:57-1301(-)